MRAGQAAAPGRVVRVGWVAPIWIRRWPASAWVMMVGITARADCRGPNALNGRKMVTGRLKLRWKAIASCSAATTRTELPAAQQRSPKQL